MTVDYGKDIDCASSIKTGRYVTGLRLVAQAVYRRLITERGALRGGPDEANYGLDLTQMVGTPTTSASAKSWESRIRSEVRKDPRILDAAVTVTGDTTTWDVTVDCTTQAGPFQLVLSVSEVTVSMVGLST